MNFGKSLRYHRIESGMTQEQVAQELGIGRQAYNMYECGKRIPNIYKAYAISKILNASLDELMQMAEEME